MTLWFLAVWSAFAADPVSWDALGSVVDAAWAEGPGAAWGSRQDGTDDARRAVPLPLHSVFAQFEPDPRPRSSAWEGTQVALQWSIGDRRGATRALWSAEGARLRADASEAQLSFARAARDAWLDAWVAEEMARHLDAFADTFETLLAPQRAAVQTGLVAPAALADLEVEVSRLRREAADARVQTADALARLAAMLGRAVVLDPVGMPDLESDTPDTTDPWRPLAGLIDQHPSIAALDAAQAVAQARARQARAAPTAVVGAGVSVRGAGVEGRPFAVPLVLVEVPLANPSAPEARAHQAEASALARERSWAAQQLHAWLDGASASWAASVARVVAVSSHSEAPLRDRVVRLQDALAAGAVSTAPLLLAVRDLHEAHHAHALAVADLVARRAQADALRRLLDGSPR